MKERSRGIRDSGKGDSRDAPGALSKASAPDCGAPGREDVSTHPSARWRATGWGRRPPAPGALWWALSEAVGRAHGGARAKHRPERPAEGRQRRENGRGWPLSGPVAEAGVWSRDAGAGGREAHAHESGQ